MIFDRIVDAFAKRVADGIASRSAAVRTPIDSAQIAQAIQGVNPMVVGNDPSNWMSPNQPLMPQQQQIAGRRFDFRVGSNLQYTPRGDEPVSFAQLRSLADGYDLLRLLIETRKDQLVKFKYRVAPIDEKNPEDERCKEVMGRLRFPDGRLNWQTWLRALVEDVLVVDAGTVYPRMTVGGKIHTLELFDGTTLKPVIDSSGRRPDPPDVAYQQILKGIPAVDYSADEIIYVPRNVRTNRLYGYSPVEQIIMTVNIALRRQISQLQAYTEGNIPDAMAMVPKEWSPKQIAEFQGYWDSLLEGDTAARRHMKFLPGGMSMLNTRQELLKDPFDEWLARVCCFCFSISPQAFVKEMNRATSESAKEAAAEEGLAPLLQWVKDLIDYIIWKYYGYTDLEFTWEEEDATDPLEAAQIEDYRIRNGTLSIDEIRQDLGRKTIGMTNAVFTATGPVLIKDIINPEQNILSPAHPDNPGNPKNVNDRMDQQVADAKTQAEAKTKADADAKTEKDSRSKNDAEKFEKALVASKPEINITLPEIVYTAPPVTVNQAPIHLRMPDVLVETGPVKVDAHFEQAAPIAKAEPKKGTTEIIAKRVGDSFVGTITKHDGKTLVMTKSVDGKQTITVNGEPVDA